MVARSPVSSIEAVGSACFSEETTCSISSLSCPSQARLELRRVEALLVGVGDELEHDVVALALDGAHEALDGVARRVLRVEIDRRRLDAPLAVLEDELELLPVRARHRRGHDRASPSGARAPSRSRGPPPGCPSPSGGRPRARCRAGPPRSACDTHPRRGPRRAHASTSAGPTADPPPREPRSKRRAASAPIASAPATTARTELARARLGMALRMHVTA